MIRRVGCFLALLMVLVTGLVQSTSVSKKVGDVQFVFRRGNTTGSVIDTSADARIVGYPDGEDTTGNGLYLTYSYADSFGYWWADSVETDVYDFYICHGAGACSLITSYQNQLVWGTGVGDSMIADTLAFAADVITRAALRNDVVGADELDNTANFIGNRFSAVQVLADTIGDKASGIVTFIDDVRGLATPKLKADSIWANDSTTILFSDSVAFGDIVADTVNAARILGTGSVTSTEILNGTILDADVNASASIALSKLASTGTLQADVLEVDTLTVEDDAYIYKKSPWKIPAAHAVLDTFIHYSADGHGVDLAAHNIGFPGAEVGEWFTWLSYPGNDPPKATTASGVPLAFAVRCTTADSVTVTMQQPTTGAIDIGMGCDTIIAVIRIGDWAGD